MSRTTREINRITTTIISMSVRLLFYALAFFLLYEGITRGYSLGHEIFAPTAVEAAPGTDREITVKEGESLSEVAEELENGGLIKNRLTVIIQAKIYDYEVYPGTYTLNTSMNSKDMLKLIDETGIERKKVQESSAAAGNSAAGSTENSTDNSETAKNTGETDNGAEDLMPDNGAANEDGAYES